ncbi:DNA-3-methyladenine glycosylase [soil metagenome]
MARRLLGCVLVRIMPDGTRLAGEIVETEAYIGPEDRASHAQGGRRTPRNEPMWSLPGTSYVYFTYGMHYCMNVACYRVDHPAAVLLRALRPLEGLKTMALHRAGGAAKQAAAIPARDLCRGPARLCQALAIARAETGTDTVTSDALFFERPPRPRRLAILTTPRIGVLSAGPQWSAAPLRFVIQGSPWASGVARLNAGA